MDLDESPCTHAPSLPFPFPFPFPFPSPSNMDAGPHLLLDDILAELNWRFAPLVREDMYGAMGKGDDLPLEGKIKLAAALLTLVPLRLSVGSAIFIIYYLICRLCTAFDVDGRGGGGYTNLMGWRRALLADGGRFLARLLLFTLGFYWIHETYLPASCGYEDPQVTHEEVPRANLLLFTCNG